MRRIRERIISGKRFGIIELSTISVLMMLSCAFFVVVPSVATAAQDGDYTYTTSGSPAVATITGYTGAGGAIVIPSTLSGYSVVAIGDGAFHDSSLTSVTIPDSVTSIGYVAFRYCGSLTSVIIPGSVATIGREVFAYCTYLTNVSILNGVTSIGDLEFAYCYHLASVTIPSSVTSIGYGAFFQCTSLISIMIPGSVINIGERAFLGCTALTSVIIPGSVTSIGDYAFYSCSSLISVTIPDNVTSIGSYSFMHCTNLTSVTIGSGVTSIGESAFSDCPFLTQMLFKGNAPTLGENWIGGRNASLVIHYYNGSTGFTTPTWNGITTVLLFQPSAPTITSATPGNTQIALVWTAPSGNGGSAITAYRIYRGITSSGEALLISLGNVFTYNNTGLTNGQTYYYKVSAVNSVGEGPQSNEVSATPATVPSVPRGLQALVGDLKVQLNWTAPQYVGPGTLTFHLFRDAEEIWSGTATRYVDTNVTNFVTYSYKIAGSNSIGWGTNCSEIQVMPMPEQRPSAPINLTATPGNENVTLSWEAPTFSNASAVVGYMISYGILPSSLTNHITWSQSTYFLEGLTKGTTYYFNVAAQNSAGWGANSTTMAVTPFGVPSAPTGLTFTVGDRFVKLNWAIPSYSGPGVLTYHLYRNDTLVWSGTQLEYNDTMLANRTTYSFSVAANNSAGWGINTSVIQATPAKPTPPGGDNTMLFVGIGAVAIVGVAAAAMVVMRRRKL